jgi:hypothetical protein
MAVHKSFRSLGARLDRHADSVDKEIQRILRGAMKVAATTAINNTPVKTGRARSNWTAARGVSPRSQPESFPLGRRLDASSAARLAEERTHRVADKWKVGDGPYHLANNVPYAVLLEQGRVRNPALGFMLKKALLAARAFLKGNPFRLRVR